MSNYTFVLRLAGQSIGKDRDGQDKTIWSMIKETRTGKLDTSWIVGSEKNAIIDLLNMVSADSMQLFTGDESVLLLIPHTDILSHVKEVNEFNNLTVQEHLPDAKDEANLRNAIATYHIYNKEQDRNFMKRKYLIYDDHFEKTADLDEIAEIVKQKLQKMQLDFDKDSLNNLLKTITNKKLPENVRLPLLFELGKLGNLTIEAI